MFPIASSPSSQWVSTGGCWLDQHPVLSALLLFVLPLALGYWYFTLRAYALAARSKAERQRIVSPVMLGPLAPSFCRLPAQRQREEGDLAPFGRWLMPYLVLRGMTVSQLARQLGQPVAAIHAVMYGVPVGTRLPSATLVDAICVHLRLDPDEGRAAFLVIASDSQPGRRLG